MSEPSYETDPLGSLLSELAARLKGETTPPAAASPGPRPPEVLGDYRIVREVGRGGMGVVYEAEQVSLARRVALKVLPLHAARDARLLERFRREAKAAARLHHTNIVPVFEVGQDGDTVFYAMQFIEGQGLDRLITGLRRRRSAEPPAATTPEFPGKAGADASAVPPPETVTLPVAGPRHCREAAQLARQAAEALAHAHARGIVHRDVKPSNLLLDESGVVWVADFGLAKTDDDGLTAPGALLGTLRYMAPERFRGAGDHRADVYALGLTLYELLVLRPAFSHPDQVQLIELVKNTDPPRPRDLDPSIPRDLETIVLKAADKDPARRYPTAADLAEDLRRFLDDEPIRARRASATERLTRWARRNPLVATLLFVIVVGTAVALAFLLLLYRDATASAADAVDKGEKLGKVNVELVRTLGERDQALGLRDEANGRLRDTVEDLRLQVYAARLGQAYRAAREDRHLAARQALAAAAPQPGQADFRHFEWHYVNRLARPELLVLSGPRAEALMTLAYSPDGKRLACAGDRGGFKVWDASDGHEVFGSPGPQKHLGLAYSPDGKYLALAFPGGIELRGAEDGRTLRTLGAPEGVRLAFSPDGGRLAVATDSAAPAVWDLGGGGGPRLMVTRRPTSHVAFGPDNLVAGCGYGGEGAVVWDATTGREVRHFSHPQFRTRLSAVAFSPDGKRLAGAGPGWLAIWDVSDGRLVAEHRQHENALLDVAFSPDGTRVATASADRTAKLADAKTGRVLRSFAADTTLVRAVAFSPDGTRLASAAQDGTVRVWDLGPPEDVLLSLTVRNRLIRHRSTSPDGTRVAEYVLQGPGVSVVDAATNVQVRRVGADAGEVRRSAYSPDGTRLAGAARDGTARVWDAASGRELLAFRGHHAPLFNVAYSPDGKLLASAAEDGEVKLWNAETGEELRTMRGRAACLWCLCFSPGGEYIGGTDGAAFSVWLVATGEEVFTRKAHLDDVTDLAFTPDGRRLFSASRDKTIKVWELPGGHEVLTLESLAKPVRRVLLEAGGTRLVSLDDAAQARVWDGRPGLPGGGAANR